ncbi:MAG: hypothetical protein M3Z32_06275 [Acidobacteriota bacterium]|nr:hypothetical protein [Acidobacteriota bacterium]
MSAVKKSHKLPRMEVPTVCEWCADDSGRVQRLHGEMLCGSCRHISRTKLVKLRQGDSFRAAIYQRMEQLARNLGCQYRTAIENPEAGLELEHALSTIAQFACGQDLFYGLASFLHHHFDPVQQQELIKLLFRIIRICEARRRQRKAAWA